MQTPTVQLRLPTGELVSASPDAVIGRSSAVTIRVDDPRVSTVHAELSWREGGFLLLSRGGPLSVAGRAVREVALRPGLEVELAPGVRLEVVDVCPGDAPVVPPTAGRERFSFRIGPGTVTVLGRAGDVLLDVGGMPAALLATLLRTPGPRPWDALAAEMWPEEGRIRADTTAGRLPREHAWTDVDERRLRNRFDQHLVVLRRALDPLRPGGLVRVQHGCVELVPGAVDVVEDVTPRMR